MEKFTETWPKAFLPLMGVPIAQFAVDRLVHQNLSKIVINVHAHPDLSKQMIRQLDFGTCSFDMSDESDELLGSAGGILQATQFFKKSTFLVLNAEPVCDFSIRPLLEEHARLKEKYGVVMTMAALSSGKGQSYRELLFNQERDLVTGLGKMQTDKPFYIGHCVMEPEALAYVPKKGPSEFYPTILEPWAQRGKIGAWHVDSEFFDVGSPKNWWDAHQNLLPLLNEGSKEISNLAKRIQKSSPGQYDDRSYWERCKKDWGQDQRVVAYGASPSHQKDCLLFNDVTWFAKSESFSEPT